MNMKILRQPTNDSSLKAGEGIGYEVMWVDRNDDDIASVEICDTHEQATEAFARELGYGIVPPSPAKLVIFETLYTNEGVTREIIAEMGNN